MTMCDQSLLDISIPLPEDISHLSRHKTACKYCGISYLMFRELTVLRQKLESACKALSIHDPNLAKDLISGEPAPLCRTQEDMHNLRSTFFTLRQFVQQTFQDIQMTTKQFEQTVLLKSEAFFRSTVQRHSLDTTELQEELSTCKNQLQLVSEQKFELDRANVQLNHLHSHLLAIEQCRDDLASANAEIERKLNLAQIRECTLIRAVEEYGQKLAVKEQSVARVNDELVKMESELKEKSQRCELLSLTLSKEVDKVKKMEVESKAADYRESKLKSVVSEREDQLGRLRHSVSNSSDQAREVLVTVRLMISGMHDPWRAQIDRAATLAHFLSATSAAMQHLQSTLAACKAALIVYVDSKKPVAAPSSNNHVDCQLRIAEQQVQFNREIETFQYKHEEDLGKCGKRLSTLKSEYERLQKKAATDKTAWETEVTNLNCCLDAERTSKTLQLSKAAGTCAELTEQRMSETNRAEVAETKLRENLLTLDALTQKISDLTETIYSQKSEMDHLLQVVKTQCEERLVLLAKLAHHSRNSLDSEQK